MESPAQIGEVVSGVLLWAIPVLAAVILHEVAHGVVALKLGDDTARRMGRLTLNPLPHIDPVGTVLLPALLLWANAPVFGYARPVPVDYRNLRDPRRGMVLVALAGPFTNLALAAGSALVFHQVYGYLHDLDAPPGALALQAAEIGLIPLAVMAHHGVVINVVLAIFNLLPIPPLDGGRVLVGLLPLAQARLVAALEPFGMLILLALLMTRSLGAILGTPVRAVLTFLGVMS